MMDVGKLIVGVTFFVIMSELCAFSPVDNYLIDCGGSSNTTIGSRVFVPDESSSLLKAGKSVAISTNGSVPSSVSSALFQTARVFTELSSYSFPISGQGRHFIRLYFFPFADQTYNLTTASFSVSAQDVKLLNNFQPQANSTIIKEYSLNIVGDTLVIYFSPSSNNSVAFVNAIEVVSVPADLFLDTAAKVNSAGTYEGLLEQTLETVERVNMGGPSISSEDDTLWRNWDDDNAYLLDDSLTTTKNYTGKLQHMQGGATVETAPDAVYRTARRLSSAGERTTQGALFNMTWQFKLEPQTSYFLRFHFCDIVSTSLNNLYFILYVGGFLAAPVDLSAKFNSLATPIFMDFVYTSGDASKNFSINIGPSIDSLPDGILNGLEIMKMNSSIGSVLAAPSGSKKNVGVIIGATAGGVAVLLIAIIIFFMIAKRKRAGKEHSQTWVPFSLNGLTTHSTGSKTSNGTAFTAGQNGVGYRFSFIVLQEATNNFDENLVIGVGGFGKVYKGVLRDDTKVAVKRGNPRSHQGLNEFRTEIELLSRLRHRHLVSLIGFCDEKNEMILVYEYMENGTLKSHLYGSDFPPLGWKQRLEACIGAARGLHYLHTGSAKAIIHRDVKSANILLDENLLAKVADFGLSKTGPELDQTHVSTAVKGSFGYLDPEYFRRQQLTEKSDVYSFGVVLLEVFCARPVIDPTLPRDMVNLAEWGMKWQKRGELEQIVDERIAGTIKSGSLRKYGETIEKCLADYGAERPSMGDVLWNLEYALQLQEAESGISELNSIGGIGGLAMQVQNPNTVEHSLIEEPEERAVAGDVTAAFNDLSDVSMSKVFSQLIKSEGR